MSGAIEIQVIGGGLAGLMLGIALRRRDVPVRVFEAGAYPRHRVCGEFLSGHGQEVLQRQEMLDAVMKAGAIEARTIAFFRNENRLRIQRLPLPTICISRHDFDAALANRFRALGGIIEANHRWRGDARSEGIVMASGRRPNSDGHTSRMFGLKAHAKNVPLDADLEMHSRKDGYVGLCRLKDGVVNVCGLFRVVGPMPDLAKRWREYLRGDLSSPLAGKLHHAEFIEDTFCSVAGLSLEPVHPAGDVMSIGDSFGMIPPVTGNGMSLALESAELAAPLLESYARGELGWNSARAKVKEEMEKSFRARLRWAGRLHRIMFNRHGAELLHRCNQAVPCIWRALYRFTH